MGKNPHVEAWLGTAHALLHDLKPKDAGIEIFGHGMPKESFAALVDRETDRVNDALIAMSLAKDESEVHLIFEALSADTVIALFSRWAHYYGVWKKLEYDPHPHLWIPPFDLWRAIFLAMTNGVPAASDAAILIWGEGCEV
jgi:hypothetical protein